MSKKCLLDRDEIRAWIEERGGTPTIIRGVDEKDGVEQPEMIHIEFGPGTNDTVRMGWAEFFDRMENLDVALVYDDEAGPHDFSFMDKKEAIRKFFPETDLPDSGSREMIKDNEHPVGLSTEEEGL